MTAHALPMPRRRLLPLLVGAVVVLLAILAVAVSVGSARQPRYLEYQPYEVDYQAAGFQPFDPDNTATYPGVTGYWYSGGATPYFDPVLHHNTFWDPELITVGTQLCTGLQVGDEQMRARVQQIIDTGGSPLTKTVAAPRGGMAIAGLVMLFCPVREPAAQRWGVTLDNFAQWKHTKG